MLSQQGLPVVFKPVSAVIARHTEVTTTGNTVLYFPGDFNQACTCDMGACRITCRSDQAFVMDAVPLNASTMVLSFQPIRQRVSSCSSHSSSLCAKSYRLRAVGRRRVVLVAVCCWGTAVAVAVMGSASLPERLR